jgi:HAD superfamily hydrolase (TIGR01490 family)
MDDSAAFFDVDGTLLDGDTDILWGRYLGQTRRIPLRRWLWLEWEFLLHQLGRSRAEPWVWLQTARAAGHRPEEMVSLYSEFAAFEVIPRRVPAGMEAIAWHRSRGHRVVLLSAVATWRLQAIRDLLGADDILGTGLEIRDGRFSGEILQPYCYGEGKVHWASRFCHEHGVARENTWYYGNSRGDIPMLRWSARPRAVRPDRWLAREAARCGWPVLHSGASWLTPEGDPGSAGPD